VRSQEQINEKVDNKMYISLIVKRKYV